MAAPKLVPEHPDRFPMDVVEMTDDLASAAERVARDGTHVVVMRDGVAIAEIAPVSDVTALALDQARRLEALRLLDELESCFSDVDPETHEREVQRAIAETRAEMRAMPAPVSE